MEQFNVEQEIQKFVAGVEAKNPNETEFIQAVKEVAATVIPFIATISRQNAFGKNGRARKNYHFSCPLGR